MFCATYELLHPRHRSAIRVVHAPSGLESFESGGASSPSSRVLAGAVAARVVVRRAQLHKKQRENIYRCGRYMASGNKSTVFIFKWRVFDFCLVVPKEKGSVQRHPDSSRLESGGASSRLVNNTKYDNY